MSVAQQLYEGLDVGEGTVGLITYLRTDSTRVATEAQAAAQELIDSIWGSEYRPKQPPQYRSKRGAQEAHEAIRPTDVKRTPESVKEYLTREQYLLYKVDLGTFLSPVRWRRPSLIR